MELPQWIQCVLKSEDLEKIRNTIVEVEKLTSGEIVPVVVRKSSVTGHVPVPLFFIFFSIAISLEPLCSGLLPNVHPAWLVALDTALCIGLALVLSRFSFFQRALTPKSDQQLQVQNRALLEFYLQGISGTKNHTGILIFISLWEKQVVVLGDAAINSKVRPEAWKELVDDITVGIANQNLAEGLCLGLRTSARMLAEHFPIQDNDVDELKNDLVVKE